MITIVDYDIINLASVKNALEKLTIPFIVSSDPLTLEKSDSLLLPGVGAAEEGMKNLQKKNLVDVIRKKVKNGTPILGICLGMQLLFSDSEEGKISCLNCTNGKVQRFQTKLKVPQIGWNNVKTTNNKSRIMKDVPDNSYFYFVHSYYCNPSDKEIITGLTEYDTNFCSVFEKDNIYGVQFHPEKSGDIGLQILKNFSKII